MARQEYVERLEKALRKIASKVDVVSDDPHRRFSPDQLEDIIDSVDAMHDENTRMHIKFVEHAVDSFRDIVAGTRLDVQRLNDKLAAMVGRESEPTTAQKAIAQGQKQAREIAKLKARQESAYHEYRVLYDFLKQLETELGNEHDLMLVDGREAFLKRLNTLRIDAESTESMSENIEELYEKLRAEEVRNAKLRTQLLKHNQEDNANADFLVRLQEHLGLEDPPEFTEDPDAFREAIMDALPSKTTVEMSRHNQMLKTEVRDAEDRYGRLDAMLEQSEGDIDSIATLLGLHHKNEDREALISRIRDRIEHIKEERDKFNQMHDDESRLTRQAESELSQIASALDISNENACDVRLKLMLARINDMKQSLTIYGSTDKYRKMLSGLLARIHRDGGHAIERLGIEGATTAADAIISDLLVAKDEAKQNKEAFEAELEGNKKIREILGAHEDEGMFDLANRIAKERAFYGIVQAQIENAARDMRNFGK